MYRVGAPRGGRVHWLFYYLPYEFKKAYILKYEYSTHQYIFYRIYKGKLYDCFVIKRTSKKYFRCVYLNLKCNKVEYFGSFKIKQIAEYCFELYLLDKNCGGGVEV